MPAPVAFILKGYPRLSETFIAQEILALEKRGLDILIVSLRKPTDTQTHPIHKEIKAEVLYLPEFPMLQSLRVAKAWFQMRRRPGYRMSKSLWFKDLAQGVSLAKLRSFPQALVLANEATRPLHSLHSHYLHIPATVTRYAALMRGLAWSCSAHARDIWTITDQEKQDKLAAMEWLVTCTEHGWKHLRDLAPQPDRVELVYHGLDFSRFPEASSDYSTADGSDPRQPVTILSVGRAVEKKGYGDLLTALSKLPANLHWRFAHIGYGPLLDDLKRQAEQLWIADRVEWRGAQPQDKVIEACRTSDIFVLANRVASDGDMDGLPNVMMEAQSQGLACLSTNLSAIPELIEDGTTGLLVEPENQDELTAALERLITSPVLRRRLGMAGAKRVRAHFSHEAGIDKLARKFDLASDKTPDIA